MRTGWLLAAACLLVAGGWNAAGQGPSNDKHVCECGAHPPGPPRDREVAPYAGEPDDLRPYAKFAEPYDLNYSRPNIYVGAARDIPEPKNLTEVRIGFFGPIENNSESVLGLRMLHGAQLAVDECECTRRLRRQTLPPDAAQRLQQLAGEGGLWRSTGRPSPRSGARHQMKQ